MYQEKKPIAAYRPGAPGTVACSAALRRPRACSGSSPVRAWMMATSAVTTAAAAQTATNARARRRGAAGSSPGSPAWSARNTTSGAAKFRTSSTCAGRIGGIPASHGTATAAAKPATSTAVGRVIALWTQTGRRATASAASPAIATPRPICIPALEIGRNAACARIPSPHDADERAMHRGTSSVADRPYLRARPHHPRHITSECATSGAHRLRRTASPPTTRNTTFGAQAATQGATWPDSPIAQVTPCVPQNRSDTPTDSTSAAAMWPLRLRRSASASASSAPGTPGERIGEPVVALELEVGDREPEPAADADLRDEGVPAHLRRAARHDRERVGRLGELVAARGGALDPDAPVRQERAVLDVLEDPAAAVRPHPVGVHAAREPERVRDLEHGHPGEPAVRQRSRAGGTRRRPSLPRNQRFGSRAASKRRRSPPRPKRSAWISSARWAASTPHEVVQRRGARRRRRA